jgi:hypothetical protein
MTTYSNSVRGCGQCTTSLKRQKLIHCVTQRVLVSTAVAVKSQVLPSNPSSSQPEARDSAGETHTTPPISTQNRSRISPGSVHEFIECLRIPPGDPPSGPAVDPHDKSYERPPEGPPRWYPQVTPRGYPQVSPGAHHTGTGTSRCHRRRSEKGTKQSSPLRTHQGFGHVSNIFEL